MTTLWTASGFLSNIINSCCVYTYILSCYYISKGEGNKEHRNRKRYQPWYWKCKSYLCWSTLVTVAEYKTEKHEPNLGTRSSISVYALISRVLAIASRFPTAMSPDRSLSVLLNLTIGTRACRITSSRINNLFCFIWSRRVVSCFYVGSTVIII